MDFQSGNFSYDFLVMKFMLKVLDIDECISNPCDSNAVCIDTINSYTCECKKGFTADGTTCTGKLIIDNL